MQLKFLGAAQEVGRSGILLLSRDANVLMDYGIKLETSPPEYPLEVKEKLDAIVLSHSHLDHCGAVPVAYHKGFRGPFFGTSVTLQVARILLKDSLKIAKLEGYPPKFSENDLDRMRRNEFSVPYRKPFRIARAEAQLFDAGHIPGSAMTLVQSEGKNVLYTGDMKVEPTYLVNGCDTDLPDVDVLITESTYGMRDHPDRKKLERSFIEEIKATLDNKGHILLPAFAVGRSQELLLLLYKHNLLQRVFLDGMGRDVLATYLNFASFIKHSKDLREIEKKVNWIHNQRERMQVLNHPSIVVTTAGMLEGGPARFYLESIYNEPKSKIVLTGYQVEDTAGRVLLEERKFEIEEGRKEHVHAEVEYFDFSAHAGRSELLKFIKKVSPQQTICVHGDNTTGFAQDLTEMGFPAVAPKQGEILNF